MSSDPTTKPHSARFWNYFVGGKDHYPVDREIGDHIKEIFPGLVDVAVTEAGTSWGVPSATSPVSRAYGSSWTSAPVCRPPTTRTRWPSAWHRTPGSCMSTTTRSC